ncbi:MAG: hypothetical protein K9L84_03560 [Candidatus Omnitrophica bacterium]|nr:hypothetical protein [Candidatus Omnitrophota bacterium]MCF7894116.1 hypothetical protein [Candidatus Omnitrophota bacterium]
MYSRKFSFTLFSLFFIFTIILSFYLSKKSPIQQKINYFLVPAKTLKITTGTFQPLVAELLFIKGVLGLSENRPQQTDNLMSLFETSIELNPKIKEAYFLGAVVVPKNKKDILKGISLLKKGLELNPSSWRIPYWIGFNYLELRIYSKVIEYYKKAANKPNSPGYIKTNLPFFYYKNQNYQQGIVYLQTLLKTVKDKNVKRIMENKINWLKNIIFLEKKIQDYKNLYKQWPISLKELVKKDLLDKIPSDPFGKKYYLERKSLKNKPKIKSKF